jgi:hypothetical protein
VINKITLLQMTTSSSSVSSSPTISEQEQQIPKWHIKADYIETCNCDYGCPCNFSGFPSNGFCNTSVGYHIREGNYGEVKLDGLDVVDVYSWPTAIHEGNGTHQLFITNKANQQEQKDAITAIYSGKAKGNGHFALFASTVKYLLDPQFVDVYINVDGRKSSFSVPGIIDVKLENFRNPVTGEDQDTKIQLPKGFIWKLADAAKTKIMRISTPSLNFDHSGKNAFYSIVEFKGP